MVEEEFGSEISDSEAEKIFTVSDAIKLTRVKAIKKKIPFIKDGMKTILSSHSAGKTTLVKLLMIKIIKYLFLHYKKILEITSFR